MERPFPAYRGSDPYLFVSYAHENAEEVYRDLTFLNDQGFRIWYDDGISPGHNWPEALAEAIAKCDLFLYFVSKDSIESSHCQRELHFAMEGDKQVVAVHVDNATLPTGLKFVLGNRQAIMKPELPDTQYRAKLEAAIGEFVTPDTPSAEPASAAEVFDSSRLTSLAIMPFVASSSDDELQSLAELCTEDLGLYLTVTEDISVASRSVVARQLATNPDPIAMGDALSVGYVVEGSLRRVGDQVRVTVELIDTASGANAWTTRLSVASENAERFLSAASERIGQGVFGQLRDRLLNEIDGRPLEQLDAVAICYKSGAVVASNADGREEEKALLQRAVETDPNHPWPRALLAANTAGWVAQGLTRHPEEDASIAREQLDAALRLGGGRAPVLGVCAGACAMLGQHSRALELSRRCHAVAPVLPAKMTLARSLVRNGDADEALKIYRTVDESTPPGYERPVSGLRDALALKEQWDEALIYARSAVDQSGTYAQYLMLANTLAELGLMDEATKAVESAREVLPPLRLRVAIAGFERAYNNQPQFTAGLRKLLEAGVE